jgi:serine/threonine protein kinase
MAGLEGQSLDRYHILEQLGEGGMATVYKAYDTRLEREVAVKVIRIEQFAPAALERILKRFEREAKALARLSHLHIIKVIDYGEHNGSPYLVMEYLPGGTLKQRLGKPISWQDAIRLLLPVAQALESAHESGLIHRDVKPSNILLTNKGQPMLTDFGIAKILETDQTTALTGTGMGVGTPEYMAPEQWKGQTSPQSDVYSLGVVLYEMLTGRKPYISDNPAELLVKQATEHPPRPSGFVKNLPEKVEQVLLKMLARNPAERYSSVSMLLADFEAIQSNPENSLRSIPGKKSSDLPDTPVPTTQPYREPKNLEKTKSKRWIMGLGALVVTVTLVFVLATATLVFVLGKILPQSPNLADTPMPSFTAPTQELPPAIINTYTLVPPTKTPIPSQTAEPVILASSTPIPPTPTLTSSSMLNFPLGKWTVWHDNCSGYAPDGFRTTENWWTNKVIIYNLVINSDGTVERDGIVTVLRDDNSRYFSDIGPKFGTWKLEYEQIMLSFEGTYYSGKFDGKDKIKFGRVYHYQAGCWTATYSEE